MGHNPDPRHSHEAPISSTIGQKRELVTTFHHWCDAASPALHTCEAHRSWLASYEALVFTVSTDVSPERFTQ